MSSRVSELFKDLRKANKTALITYITAGFPNQNLCQDILNQMAESGSDIIELGMPFSDPMADGPIIQESSKLVLDNNHTMRMTFDLVERFRKKNSKTPIILMGYYNPIYQFGSEEFLNECKKYNIDGLIIVDLPPEHDDELCDLAINLGIDFIRMVTPTTNKNRLKMVLDKSSGFLYYVSVMGITGTKRPDLEILENQVKDLKKSTELPVAVGFGIKESNQARKISKFSDAIVIGTAFIEIIMQSYKNNENNNSIIGKASDYIRNIKSAL